MKQPDDQTVELINSSKIYTMWSVFATTGEISPDEREKIVADAEAAIAETGVVVRGYYDVAGLRADADLMVWWHAESIEGVQAAYHALLNSDLPITPVWSVTGLHRPAEFNKRHLPGFLLQPEAPQYLCVYPFVRSYEWYLLEESERSRILRDHGMTGAPYKDVVASTIASFGLNDYEWIVALEADQLDRIVDLMRDFRYTEARLHVRVDTPFYTGPKVTLGEWAERQPRGE
ncbi:MAG: hydrogen peroxide-dependent heme synthase [Flaviflexus sp.]|uniref:Coproheme decarboxylase n=1 Tax=Flaviflexus ciconiae TaxID=2496867 RepID=A0A3S9PY31_9ACTO|nr:hydrogen peroxide-dependent heme synthase [Flaviflexus ciconiae]AZQ77303.1 chlorite dismutase [Flaviflexus ciconiae]